MENDLNNFFSHMFYDRLKTITGINFESDDHKTAQEICSTIFWMKKSKLEFNFDMTEKDFNYCQARTDSELYTTMSMFSKEALSMQSYEFAVIMQDFADLIREKRGLGVNVLPMVK